MREGEDAVEEVARCGEWIGALVDLPSYVTGEGQPYRPTAVLWIEVETDLIVGSELVRPDEALARAVAAFETATRAPLIGKPRVPRQLRVADEALADALGGAIRDDIEIVVGPIPEIDEAVRLMMEQLSRDGDEDAGEFSYFGDSVTAEDLEWFFRCSARLYRSQPWVTIPTDELVGVSCELLGVTEGSLAVVGQQGESFGFTMVRSPEDVVALSEAAARHQRGEEAGAFPPSIMLSYDRADALPPSMRAEIEKYGWELAGPVAYPSAMLIDSDLVSRSLTRTELMGVTAIIEALAELVETEPDFAEVWQEGEPMTWSRRIPSPGGEVVVELSAPQYLTVEQEGDADGPIIDDEGVLDDEIFEDYRDELMAQFAESPEARGNEGMIAVAEMLIEHAARYQLTTITRITPAELRELLFETLPRHVSVDSDAAPEIIDSLRALLEFAARAMDSASARECLESLPADVVKQLARELDNESKFGTAKSLVMAGIKAGYDLSTPEGVNAWIEVVNQQAAPRAKTAGSKTKKKKKSAPKAKKSAAKVKKSAPKAKPAAKKAPRKKSSSRR